MADRPRLWSATEALCWCARDILRKRQTGYPAAIEARQLTADAAAVGLRVAAAIASDWTRAIELSANFPEFTPQPLPEPLDRFAKASPTERVTALAAVTRHPAVKADPAYAEIVEALLWWEQAAFEGLIAPIGLVNQINARWHGTSAREAA